MLVVKRRALRMICDVVCHAQVLGHDATSQLRHTDVVLGANQDVQDPAQQEALGAADA